MKKRGVLAYSGGLDTSAIIPWLKENFDFEVIAYCCNLGNLPSESELRERSLHLGAKKFIYEDSQEQFVSDFVFPMLRGGATYFDDNLLGTAIARPLIAKKVAAFAKKEGADFLIHGATGKGNDHIRFEKAWAYLCPELEIVAPWKVWPYRSREELISYLLKKGLPWNEKQKTYSVDANSFHRSCEGNELEDIEGTYSQEHVQQWISLERSSETTEVVVQVNNGEIQAIDGKKMSPRQVLETLNVYGAKHGIGICDIVEERINGIKSRGIYETPGGTIAQTVLRSLKQICWSRELYTLAQLMSDRYGQLIYDGDWFSDACETMNAFFKSAADNLCGEITLQLSDGRIRILSRKSSRSLYKPSVVSFESDLLDIHKASLGYSKMLTLSSALQGQRKSEQS